jgi:hypothetical protein
MIQNGTLDASTPPWTDEERKNAKETLEEILADGEFDLSPFYI